MSSYQCPKCFNILPISNKILHDLKCTKERPVQFSQENPYTSSISYNYDDGLRYSTNDYSNLRISTDLNLASELRNSAGSRYYKRMSYMNDDGTTTEIKKDTNMSGKEELLEITYDPQGNIIGRKKADGGRSSVRFKFHELQDYSSYDPMDNYNIYEGGSVYVQTVPTTEIIYEPVTSYTIDYSNANNLYEHDFGTTGYSLMHNNINNGRMVNLDNNNTNSNNTYSNSYTTNYQTNNTNSNLNQYFTDYNYNNTYTNQNSNVINNSNNYSTTNYNNYFQNTTTNTLNTGNNYNYQNNQSNNDFQCARVTKLN